MKKLSYTLITLAVININFAPTLAMETNVPKSWGSNHYPYDATGQIKGTTETNLRRCIYISWARIWWCFTWGEDDD